MPRWRKSIPLILGQQQHQGARRQVQFDSAPSPSPKIVDFRDWMKGCRRDRSLKFDLACFAGRQYRLSGEWPAWRWPPWTRSSCSVPGRPTSSTSAAARYREGHRSLQDHAQEPPVKGILVNIFGGIMRCDTIATGVVAAAQSEPLRPLVVVAWGTNETSARRSGRRFGSADHLRRHHGGSHAKDRRCGEVRKSAEMSSDQQEHQGHHPGHHRQDRPVPHREVHRVRQRQNCSSPAWNPKKAGEKILDVPICNSVRDTRTPAPPSR